MLFEHNGAEREGDLHGFEIVRPFMGGIADGNLGISFPQQRDLAEVQVIVRSRILADAMHDGEEACCDA